MVNDTSKSKDDVLNTNQDSLGNEESDKQILFRFFGIEMLAPKGLKNPRIIYISFILINFILLLFVKNLTMG